MSKGQLSNKRKVKLAILGAGKMGYWHLRAYKSNPNVEVLAICNPSSDKGVKLAKKFGIPHHFKDPDDVMALRGLDAIDICAPTGLHKELIRKGLEAGLSVYTEKPMCMDVKEADQIVELNKKAQKTVFVGYNLRFCREFIESKKIIESGELGDVRFIQFTRGALASPGSYTFSEDNYAGIIKEFSSHALDIFRWWGFKEARSVSAAGSNVFDGLPSPDSVSLNISFKGNVLATVVNTYGFPSVSNQVLVCGTKKTLQIKYGKVLISKIPSVWSVPAMLKLTFKEAVVFPYRIMNNPLKGACDRFIQCVQKNEQSPLNEIEGRETLKLAELLAESYDKNQVITL